MYYLCSQFSFLPFKRKKKVTLCCLAIIISLIFLVFFFAFYEFFVYIFFNIEEKLCPIYLFIIFFNIYSSFSNYSLNF